MPHLRIKATHAQEAIAFRNRQRRNGNGVAGDCLRLKGFNGRPEACPIAA